MTNRGPTIPPAPHERFATELNKLMEGHEPPLAIKDLAGELGVTYEFARKLHHGQNLPTRGSLIILSRLFKVPIEPLELLVQEDKCAAEYGLGVASILFDPVRRPLVEGISRLGDCDQRKVFQLLHDLLGAVCAR